jgi:hypothetical protein
MSHTTQCILHRRPPKKTSRKLPGTKYAGDGSQELKAKFVCASLGQTRKGATDGGGKILDAMLAVDGTSGKYPEFQGNVAPPPTP